MDQDTKLQLAKEIEFLKKHRESNFYHIATMLLILIIGLLPHLSYDYSKYFLYIFPIIAILGIFFSFRALYQHGAKLDSEKRLFVLLDKILDADDTKTN